MIKAFVPVQKYRICSVDYVVKAEKGFDRLDVEPKRVLVRKTTERGVNFYVMFLLRLS